MGEFNASNERVLQSFVPKESAYAKFVKVSRMCAVKQLHPSGRFSLGVGVGICIHRFCFCYSILSNPTVTGLNLVFPCVFAPPILHHFSIEFFSNLVISLNSRQMHPMLVD